jgi:hypothetical protein
VVLAVQKIRSPRWKYSLVHKVNHILSHDRLKTSFFLPIAAFRITALLTPMNQPH